jgi:hypothetical protein
MRIIHQQRENKSKVDYYYKARSMKMSQNKQRSS